MRNGTEERCAMCNYAKIPGESFIRCKNCDARFCPFCAVMFLGVRNQSMTDTCPYCRKK